MSRMLAPLCLLAALWALPAAAQVNDQLETSPQDWPWWRGATRDGVAAADPRLPTEWSSTQNVVWKTSVPGRGHSSPIVYGEHVYLTTCDERTDAQSVLCYDRATGKLLWQTEVFAKGGMRKNAKASGASSSAACDGQRIYVTFPNAGALHAVALTREGKIAWQTKISDYVEHQGYAASPALYQGLVLCSSDNKGGGALAGLERETGNVVWKHDRPTQPNYTSPVVVHVAGRDQLVMTGCDLVSSFDPLTGKVLWETKGATTECVTSTVTDGRHVFTSGGYPKNHMSAIVADGSGKLAWETKDRVYVPSFMLRDGYLYGTLDAGVAACWKSDTGEEQWKQRLGGTFSASPVLAGDKIYATNEAGETFIYLAQPDKYVAVGQSKLGDEVFATPTLCGGKIFMRVAEQVDGKRQEALYCLGKVGK